MTTQAHTQVSQAIEDSIRESRIVHLSAQVDTQEWIDLADELSSVSDDHAEQSTELGVSREYWGVDEDGDEWRIHLDGSSSKLYEVSNPSSGAFLGFFKGETAEDAIDACYADAGYGDRAGYERQTGGTDELVACEAASE